MLNFEDWTYDESQREDYETEILSVDEDDDCKVELIDETGHATGMFVEVPREGVFYVAIDYDRLLGCDYDEESTYGARVFVYTRCPSKYIWEDEGRTTKFEWKMPSKGLEALGRCGMYCESTDMEFDHYQDFGTVFMIEHGKQTKSYNIITEGVKCVTLQELTW